MKFTKDILLIDFEGFHQPIQIAAILLDKETLEEKDSFLSYINSDLDSITHKVTGISQEDLVGAPSRAEVGKIVFEKFGLDIIIASFVAELDMRHFRTITTAAGIDQSKYNYHVLDIWPVAYIHLLKKGYTGSIRSEEIFKEFGAKPRTLHNALEDCRITADVLRKIIFDNEK